jgi:UDP-N-acetylglucosamine 2-epimerase (non-hydrolysing)
LGVRKPDHFLGARGSFGEQVATILMQSERVLFAEKPDKFLVLGDTNSSLAAIMAKRMHIPVYHMEAGNRCFDDRVPEEVNRRIIDHSSDVLMPYTERSRQNLLREGIPGERIHVTGNPIYEVIHHYGPQISQSDILTRLELESGKYFLATMHREENVDIESRMQGIISALDQLQREYNIPVVISTHPRTRMQMDSFGIMLKNQEVRFFDPFSFFDFITLERNALCVLSDSGTVQEECCILRVANVTIRDVTERPETIECGSNILSGVDPEMIVSCVRAALDHEPQWTVPPEYLESQVSTTIVKIVLSYFEKNKT